MMRRTKLRLPRRPVLGRDGELVLGWSDVHGLLPWLRALRLSHLAPVILLSAHRPSRDNMTRALKMKHILRKLPFLALLVRKRLGADQHDSD